MANYVTRRATKPNLNAGGGIIYKKGFAAIATAIALGPIALVLAQNTASQKPEWVINLPEFRQLQSGKLPLSISLPDGLKEQVWHSGDTWISFAQSQKKSADEKLVPYLPQLFDKSIWHVEKQLEPGLNVYRNILTRDKVLVTQWYKVGSQRTWSYRNAKLLQVPAALGGETRFALVTIQTFCGPRDCTNVLAQMQTTMSSLDKQI